MLEYLKRKLNEVFMSSEERYLSGATDCADLERRLENIDKGRFRRDYERPYY